MSKNQKMSKSKSGSNKPSWKHAPEWARYLAMDSDGEWLWHEKTPTAEADGCWDSYGRSSHAASGSELDREKHQDQTLESRSDNLLKRILNSGQWFSSALEFEHGFNGEGLKSEIEEYLGYEKGEQR